MDDVRLQAYLDIVGFTSSLFSEIVPASTIAEANLVMQPGGPDIGDTDPSNMRGKALKRALGTWLNFASGALGLDDILPGGGTFAEAMAQVETIILDPTSTHEDYTRASNLLRTVASEVEGNEPERLDIDGGGGTGAGNGKAKGKNKQ